MKQNSINHQGKNYYFYSMLFQLKYIKNSRNTAENQEYSGNKNIRTFLQNISMIRPDLSVQGEVS